MDFSTPEKDFDCLKMKEKLQSIVYEEIKHMTLEERLEYFKIPPEKSIFKFRREKIN